MLHEIRDNPNRRVIVTEPPVCHRCGGEKPKTCGTCGHTPAPCLLCGGSGRYGVSERAADTGHPCPKPRRAWEWLVDKVAPPGATVFDPCMGGGETGVACVRTGRPFVGCEIEPEYFGIACKRIQAAWDAEKSSLFPAFPEAPS